MNSTAPGVKTPNPFALSFYWFAWELQWAALLGAALQAEIARFVPPTFYGRASAILLGCGALIAIVIQYGAGRWSDIVRRRMPFIIVGTLINFAGLYMFALAPSFLAVLVAFVVLQLLNIAGGAYQALIPDRVAKSAQGSASAVMGLMRLAGTAGGLLLAKLVVHQPGPDVTPEMYTSGFLRLVTAIAVIMLAALLVTVFGVKERREDVPEAVPVLTAWPLRASFWWLIGSRTLVSAGLYSILPFLGFYLRFALKIDRYQATSLTLLLLMVGCSLVGTVPAGLLGDRISKKSIIYISLALIVAAALTVAFATSLTPVAVLSVFLGIGWGAYYSVDWALACNLLPPGRAGALMALWNIGASAPQVAAPIIGGLLVDHLGAVTGDLGIGYRSLFGLVAVWMVLGGLALTFVREPREGVPPRTP